MAVPERELADRRQIELPAAGVARGSPIRNGRFVAIEPYVGALQIDAHEIEAARQQRKQTH